MIPIDFVFFDAGGGHRAAATALKKVATRAHPEWDIRMVQLQDVLQPADIFRRWFGISMENVYNEMLARGWTLGSTQILPFMHALIRLFQPQCVKLLEAHWRRSQPRLVVSVIPNFNRALYLSLRNVLPATPLVTILTDLADYPPHFWIERQEQNLICGTAKAANQARKLGYADHRIFRTSGMILRPDFYDVAPVDRAAERRRLGLDPGRPTGLVLFGGFGSPWMAEIARRIDQTGLDVQLILICGRNEKLRLRLEQEKFRMPVHVEGFTTEVPRFMQVSDFLIGKPGPGSISEAFQMNLPVIVERNAWTLPQERYNTEWVQEKGAGLVVKNFREIGAATAQLLERLPDYQAHARAIENRAVFEIPAILEQLIDDAGPAAGAMASSGAARPL